MPSTTSSEFCVVYPARRSRLRPPPAPEREVRIDSSAGSPIGCPSAIGRRRHGPSLRDREDMNPRTVVDPVTVEVGSWPRAELLESLRSGGVHLNEWAATLLDDAIFDRPSPESVTVVERSVRDLGLLTGAVLPRIFEAAQERGLLAVPPNHGPLPTPGVALPGARTRFGDVDRQGAVGIARRGRTSDSSQ